MRINPDDVYGAQFDLSGEGVALTDEQALAVVAYQQQWDAMAESERRRAEGALALVEWCIRMTSRPARRLLGAWSEGVEQRAERYRWHVDTPDED